MTSIECLESDSNCIQAVFYECDIPKPSKGEVLQSAESMATIEWKACRLELKPLLSDCIRVGLSRFKGFHRHDVSLRCQALLPLSTPLVIVAVEDLWQTAPSDVVNERTPFGFRRGAAFRFQTL